MHSLQLWSNKWDLSQLESPSIQLSARLSTLEVFCPSPVTLALFRYRSTCLFVDNAMVTLQRQSEEVDGHTLDNSIVGHVDNGACRAVGKLAVPSLDVWCARCREVNL